MKTDPGHIKFLRFTFRFCLAAILLPSCKKETTTVAPIAPPAPVPSAPPPPTTTTTAPTNLQLEFFDTLSLRRYFMASGAAGNKLVFVGGRSGKECYVPGGDYGDSILSVCISESNRVDIYDTSTRSWSIHDLSRSYNSMNGTTAGDKIFFVGGVEMADHKFSNKIDIYNASSDTWSIIEMSETRFNMSVGVLGNKLFFAGGVKVLGFQNLILSNKVDIYDVSTGSWSEAKLSEARCGATVATVGNKILFAGGDYFGWFPVSSRVDIYDVSTNTWSVSSLSEARSTISGITIGDKVFFVGGRTGFNIPPSRQVDIYDNTTQSWSVKEVNFFLDHSTSVLNGNFAYFFTGSKDVHVYNVAPGTWSAATLNADIGYSSILATGKYVYFAGGGGYPDKQHNLIRRLKL